MWHRLGCVLARAVDHRPFESGPAHGYPDSALDLTHEPPPIHLWAWAEERAVKEEVVGHEVAS